MDLLAELTRIDFTEYEARVYLTLLREHPATGYQISKKSGVPRSMVYEALGRLHARGAVLESIEDRATLYRPLPPNLLIDRHEDEHRRIVKNLREGMQALYTASDEDHIWSISGSRAALTYAAQMIRGATSEVYLVLTDEDVDVLHEHIAAAWSRQVDVNALLMGERELDCGRVAYHPPRESESQGLTGALQVVVDNTEALIASRSQDMTAAITRNANLVLIAKQFVWMELFTQRIYARLGADLLEKLDPSDRQIFEGLDALREGRDG